MQAQKNLWQICFGDFGEYTNLFFDDRLKEGYGKYIFEKDICVSAAYSFPYQISVQKSLLNSAYILGVSTHLDYRRKGLTSKLMHEILEEEQKKGTDLAFLIPAEEYLFNIYRKYGFECAFTIYKHEVKTAEKQSGCEIKEWSIHEQFNEQYDFYSSFYNKLNSAVLKNKSDYIFAAKENLICDAKILTCFENGKIAGFAVVYENTVKELLCDNKNARETIFAYLLEKYNSITVFEPTNEFCKDAEKISNGMARVLNPLEFLKKLQGKKDMAIKIADDIFECNNGVYIIKNDDVSYLKNANYDVEINIKDLASQFINSYANLLMN